MKGDAAKRNLKLIKDLKDPLNMEKKVTEQLKKKLTKEPDELPTKKKRVQKRKYFEIKDYSNYWEKSLNQVSIRDDQGRNHELLQTAYTAYCHYFMDVAKRNGTCISEMLSSIFSILTSSNGKKNALIFIGSSDSGKSTVLDLLSSIMPIDKVGSFRIPVGNIINNFWLSNLVGDKEIYRCDEFLIETIPVWQEIKTITEGSPYMELEVKFKSSTRLNKKPVLMSGNQQDVGEICKWMSSEVDSFENRFYVVNTHDIKFNKYIPDELHEKVKLIDRYILRMLYDNFFRTPYELKKRNVNSIFKEDLCKFKALTNNYIN